MKMSLIFKIIAFIIFLILMIFFVFENIDPVPIWIPLFKGRHIGLIYIMLVFYLLGISNAVWVITMIGLARKKKMKLAAIPDHDQTLFEDEA